MRKKSAKLAMLVAALCSFAVACNGQGLQNLNGQAGGYVSGAEREARDARNGDSQNGGNYQADQSGDTANVYAAGNGGSYDNGNGNPGDNPDYQNSGQNRDDPNGGNPSGDPNAQNSGQNPDESPASSGNGGGDGSGGGGSFVGGSSDGSSGNPNQTTVTAFTGGTYIQNSIRDNQGNTDTTVQINLSGIDFSQALDDQLNLAAADTRVIVGLPSNCFVSSQQWPAVAIGGTAVLNLTVVDQGQGESPCQDFLMNSQSDGLTVMFTNVHEVTNPAAVMPSVVLILTPQ